MDLNLDTMHRIRWYTMEDGRSIKQTKKKNKDDQLDQNFFQDDNDNQKKLKEKVRRVSKEKTNYSSNKVKAINLLTNISYRQYEPKDFNYL